MNTENYFKVGDIIRGINNNGYGITNGDMKKAEVIRSYGHDMRIKILEHEDSSNVGETFTVDNSIGGFKKYISHPTELHITTDGYKTYGILKENGKVIKREEAKCHPKDTFDFQTGANIVMHRLFTKKEKQLYLIENGKNIGELGKPIEQKDSWGNELHIGDIVEYYALSSDGENALEPVGQAIAISNSELIVISKGIGFNSGFPFGLKTSYESMTEGAYYENTNIRIGAL